MAEVQPLFRPEPAACGGRIDPGQHRVPGWLVTQVDWHVRPSASPWAISTKARIVCQHVDWELIWTQNPELFDRRRQIGAPPPLALWEAKRVLAQRGVQLCFDVELEDDEQGGLCLAVYGAGVVGRLSTQDWEVVARLLTTCASRVRQPRRGADANNLLRPAPPPQRVGPRAQIAGVRPAGWEVGDWAHTWWSYPTVGTLRTRCSCPAHSPEAEPTRSAGMQASA